MAMVIEFHAGHCHSSIAMALGLEPNHLLIQRPIQMAFPMARLYDKYVLVNWDVYELLQSTTCKSMQLGHVGIMKPYPRYTVYTWNGTSLNKFILNTE